MWFGKKAAEDAVKGIGGWIDEQQFTQQEQLDAKLKLFGVIHPFKAIQRIIVTWVMYVWAGLAASTALSLWIGFIIENYAFFDKHLEFLSIEFIWVPCFGVFSLYLTGGLPFLSKSKKK